MQPAPGAFQAAHFWVVEDGVHLLGQQIVYSGYVARERGDVGIRQGKQSFFEEKDQKNFFPDMLQQRESRTVRPHVSAAKE